MHHSDPDLHLTTGLRFHRLEALLRLGVGLCIVALLGLPPAGVLLHVLLVLITRFLTHPNVALSDSLDRVIRNVFVSPRASPQSPHAPGDQLWSNLLQLGPALWHRVRAFGSKEYGVDGLGDDDTARFLFALQEPFRRPEPPPEKQRTARLVISSREEEFSQPMPVVNEYAPGAPCWYELATTDREAANAFYADIFGWTVDNVPTGPGQTYSIFKLSGLDVAASCDVQQQGQHPHWLTYFNTPDIDAVAAKATELGGSVIMPPFDVATHGRMAVIRDPEGVYFALWKSGTHIGAQRNGDNNSIGWSELASRDNEAAAKFYSELLGIFVKNHAIGNQYIEFGAGDRELGGLLKMDSNWGDVPPHWSFYVKVADCDAVVARVKELGGKVIHGPFDAPGVGRIGMLLDPQGAKFSVITLSAAA